MIDENIVEIVRDPAGQSAEPFHLLRLDELLLEPLTFRVVKQVDVQLAQLALS